MSQFSEASTRPLNSRASNGTSNGTINGRGIARRDLSHRQLVGLAADAVSGVHPVQPSLGQVPSIFAGVTQAEVSEELKRREATAKANKAEEILFAFADLWAAQPFHWRVYALQWIGELRDLRDIEVALRAATVK